MSDLPIPSLPPQPPPSAYLPPVRQAVVVTDIDMSIGAMCRFMVKWVIATIPALIILWVLFVAAVALVALVFGGVFQGLLHSVPRNL